MTITSCCMYMHILAQVVKLLTFPQPWTSSPSMGRGISILLTELYWLHISRTAAMTPETITQIICSCQSIRLSYFNLYVRFISVYENNKKKNDHWIERYGINKCPTSTTFSFALTYPNFMAHCEEDIFCYKLVKKEGSYIMLPQMQVKLEADWWYRYNC